MSIRTARFTERGPGGTQLLSGGGDVPVLEVNRLTKAYPGVPPVTALRGFRSA